MEGNYPKTGYINSPFRLFYLHETSEKDFTCHYHDFHKILLFLDGNVGYFVEGRSYELRPQDIVLVRAGEIHRPVIHDHQPYERIILYLSPDFLKPESQEGCDLNLIFDAAAETGSNLVSIQPSCGVFLNSYIRQMKDSLSPDSYGTALYQKTVVLSFLLWLNRTLKGGCLRYRSAAASNRLILQLVDDINTNITADLSIDGLAEKYHISRSHLMHLFKSETGFTVLNYITEKRLFLAKQSIKNGMSVTQACFSCGFADYSCFYRAFRTRFGVAPKDAGKLL